MSITILDNTDKLELTTSISEKANTIHTHTAEQAGADPVGSAASALESAKSYTDTKIADLINGAPSTLDTLGEIAAAMAGNADVVEALNEAIGSKANAADLAAHTGNKSNPHEVNLGQLGVTATANELNYVGGVTSNIQTQLDAKVPTSRTINGKALSGNITLSAGDVGALPSSTHIPSVAGLATETYVNQQIANALDFITEAEIDDICTSTLDVDNTLVDDITGKNYALYVSDGDLKMTEVS